MQDVQSPTAILDESEFLNPTHGWQKVVYPKRQRKSAVNNNNSSNGVRLSNGTHSANNVFKSIEEHSDRRRAALDELAARAESEIPAVMKKKNRGSDSNSDSDEDDAENGKAAADAADAAKKAKKKEKKEKKPKVSVSEAAAKIDASDLSAFLVDVSEAYKDQDQIQLTRLADYFGRAFAEVHSSQFPWVKLFRESTVAKIVDIPLSHISETVYKTSVDWINKRNLEALAHFALWSLQTILDDLATHQPVGKGSKKVVHQSSKSQVAIFVVLAMVLRRKPDVLVSILPTLKENSKYQGQDKLSVIVWMMAQACQGDLTVGLYSWAHNLLPMLGGRSSCNPQSRDLILQFVERVLAGPKARAILVNGAVRKGERLIPPASYDVLMRVTFPAASARVKATERFAAVYPTLKEVALAGVPGSKSMKQVSQQIFSYAIKAAGESIPELSKEATNVAVWSLTQHADCYKEWEKIYEENIEASVVILKKLSSEWKEHSVKHSSLDSVRETLTSFRQKEVPTLKGSSSSSGDGYVGLFVRMLGLDNDLLDREQAVEALWKYSLGGRQCIDAIMQFQGCINLIVNLLKSESNNAREAAAGILRTISSINMYRDSVAESGAIEGLTGLLYQPSLTSEVKEQCICTLWNLSVDEKHRTKISSEEILPLLINALEDEDMKVKEAVGGVLANLTLSESNHNILVEAGVIPKLAKLLNSKEGSKVCRKEARNALLELAKDEYYRILIVEEGLVRVPLIGSAAYTSLKPVTRSWPSLPDGTPFDQSLKVPSKFGASELLLGLSIDEKNIELEEAKVNALVGRTQQQFLARIGAIEMEVEKSAQPESSNSHRFTLLPWMDGVARLVLILDLEDDSAITRAAESVADASVNEHMRIAFKEAGAIKRIVQLLDHQSDAVKFSATRALERLSISGDVCQDLETEDILDPLFNNLKHSEVHELVTEKTLDILARILDPTKELKSKFYDGPVNGFNKANYPAGPIGENAEKTSARKSTDWKNKPDSAATACLVEILKVSPPNLQRKAASILEFMTVTEQCLDKFVQADIEKALDAVFQQKYVYDEDSEINSQQLEAHVLELEEVGLAISAASRLLTKLLDFKQFCDTINSIHFMHSLQRILKSSIPLHSKDWVAACLVRLSTLSGPYSGLENPITTEVTLYQTIPSLISKINSSYSMDAQEAAVIELNRIISEGVVDSPKAVATQGGIFPLVKLIEEGSPRAIEAGLAILYNLSMDEENHSAIIAAGAAPILKRIVLSHGPQWTRALLLLRNLPT